MMRDRFSNGRWIVVAVLLCLVGAACSSSGGDGAPARPNVLWIVADDLSFEIGAYGDPLARTPNIDRLASEGVRYTNAFSTAGVCAPSRVALMTGTFATTMGAHHMRSLDGGYQPVPAPDVKTFTEPLRAAGYWSSSLTKLDYQFSGVFDGAPRTNWDEPDGDWRGRAADQPFFSHVTIFDTHESFLLAQRPVETDPAAVPLPPYYPDTPAVRHDLAQHYDNVARLDARVGEILAMLEEDGLADDTVVFFFADNGRGLPRDKRWVYDGGIHLPLIVRWPGKLEAGTVSEELVSWVDLAPTALALAGLRVPAHMQGRVFVGDRREPEPEFVYAAEDRHDEATDRIRAVRDRRWKYVRNYQPDTPYGQPITFRDRITTMQEIFRLHDAGQLFPPADWYYRATKPVEELYDTLVDPYEIDDVAARPENAAQLERMRAAHERWVVETGDLGAVPEAELAERFWPGGVQPVTPSPRIIPGSGTYDGRLEVRITSDVDGASIAYTTEDGDDARWRLYAGPFEVAPRATVRALAVRYGWAESAPVAATYARGR